MLLSDHLLPNSYRYTLYNCDDPKSIRLMNSNPMLIFALSQDMGAITLAGYDLWRAITSRAITLKNGKNSPLQQVVLNLAAL